jgi:hypothetical protein
MKLIACSSLVLMPCMVWAQGTLADYHRGEGLRGQSQGLVVNVPGTPNWIGDTEHFWYTRTVKGGTEFEMVYAETGAKKLAFDHQRLAAAISSVTGHQYAALALPFAPPAAGRGGGGGGGRGAAGPAMTAPLTFTNGESAIEFGTAGSMYRCSLTDYTCTKAGAIPQPVGGRGARGEAPWDESPETPAEEGGDPVDGMEYQPPPPQDGAGPGGFGRGQTGCATASGKSSSKTSTSSCGRRALPGSYPVELRRLGREYYTLRSVAWSPDSKKLVAYHTRPGYDHQVHYIESSPADQVQPKHDLDPTASRATRWISPIPLCSTWRLRRKSRSTTRCSRMLTTSRRRCGGRIAAPSPSNTTSAGTRLTA